jgi:hypothetical protein
VFSATFLPCARKFGKASKHVMLNKMGKQKTFRFSSFSMSAMATETRIAELPSELRYIQYDSSLESQYLPSIRALIGKDLSEPYSIYVYRYFLYQWGDLCFMVTSISTLLLEFNTKCFSRRSIPRLQPS